MKRIEILFSLLIAATALLSAAGCAAAPKQVRFDGATYTYQTSQGQALVYQSETGAVLRVEKTVDGVRVQAGGQRYQVRGTASDLTVTFPDGRELSRSYQGSSSSGSADPGATISLEDWDRVSELREIVFHPDAEASRGARSLPRLLSSLLLIGLGIFEILNPRLAFRLAEGWRYQNLEPSDLYLNLSRLGGVVFILVGLFLLMGGLG